MDIRVDAIQSVTDIPECISIAWIQHKTAQNEHLQHLKNFIISGQPTTREEPQSNIRPYWSYRDDLAVIDSGVMKGRHIIVPAEIKQQVLDQLPLKTQTTSVQISLLG